MNPNPTVQRPPAPKREDPELGLVKLCVGCDEEWPLDGEFWYLYQPRNKSPYWSARCLACLSEYKIAKYLSVRVATGPVRQLHGRRNTPEYSREANRRYYASLTPEERVARREAHNIRRRAMKAAARAQVAA